MYRFLMAPRWVVLHLIVVLLSVTCIGLGLWQLRRLDERRLQNQVYGARLASAPEDLAALLTGAGDDIQSLEYHKAVATGHYLPEQELLIRSQVFAGRAGYHVLTPLRLDGGGILMVNRGWVPLEMDNPPVAAAPPGGTVIVAGVLRQSQQRTGLGPVDDPDAVMLARVDLTLLSGRFDEPVLPVYLVVSENPESLPVPVETPTFSDEGPHLAYAIQWFSFTVIGIVGYGFLIRRNRKSQVGNHLDAADLT